VSAGPDSLGIGALLRVSLLYRNTTDADAEILPLNSQQQFHLAVLCDTMI
jgi:hypothetical protein